MEDILKKQIKDNYKKTSTPIDFTNKVMHKIDKSVASKTVIEPLISKKIWSVFGAVSVSVFCSFVALEAYLSAPYIFRDLQLSPSPSLTFTLQSLAVIITLIVIDGLLRKGSLNSKYSS